ncbi:hypothetical protein ACIQTN_25880 [Streptomyces werraensis]|uniref:hypothetical protein n=1 Tax=Streptomyces werraensis TaxID=68284 RepID=UPI0037F52C83
MDEPTPTDVDRIVAEAQRLDELKQRIIDDLAAEGVDPGEVRVIVASANPDGSYRADELLTPEWMKERRRG